MFFFLPDIGGTSLWNVCFYNQSEIMDSVHYVC
jgi:hypothetical protein